jgi:hypothetical protein
VATVLRMVRMRRLSLACCVLCALAVAGCGSSGGGGGSTQRAKAKNPASVQPTAAAKKAVLDAASQTATSTASVHISVVLRKPGSAQTSHYQADGTIVPAGGKLVIDRTALNGGTQTEIFLHQQGHLVLYTNPVQATLAPGKTWLKVDMTKYGKLRYGTDATFLAGADQDPLAALQLLGSPAAKVKDLGQDWLPNYTLNTKYEGKVDVLAAAKAAGATKAGLAKLRSDLGQPTQTIDVWVNEQGRLGRVTVSGPAKAPDGTVYTLQTVTDFTDYGKSATVKPPPAKKTEDYFTQIKSGG